MYITPIYTTQNHFCIIYKHVCICIGGNIKISTVKSVLSGHSKIGETKVLKTNVNLMNVESIAECSLGHSAILWTCIKR